MSKTIGVYTKELKDDLKDYIDLRSEDAKLFAFEKSARLAGKSTPVFAFIFFGFFAFFFLSFSLGFLLGERLNSMASGFGIVTGVYLLFGFFLYLFRKRLELVVEDKILEALMDDDNE